MKLISSRAICRADLLPLPSPPPPPPCQLVGMGHMISLLISCTYDLFPGKEVSTSTRQGSADNCFVVYACEI